MKRLSHLLPAAAVALGLSTAYAAENATGPDTDAGAGGWHHAWHGHRHDDGTMLMRELGKLHNELKLTLTPAQEQLWQNALQTMTQARDAGRAEHETARKQFEGLAQQPILDLDAMHDAHQKLANDERERREQVAAAWLKVYDGLSAQQKKVVSDDIKAHFSRMAHRRGWMMGHGHDDAGASTPQSQ